MSGFKLYDLFSPLSLAFQIDRSKGGSRSNLGADAEVSEFNPTPTGFGDAYIIDGFSLVRKSSSTSSLQDRSGLQ